MEAIGEPNDADRIVNISSGTMTIEASTLALNSGIPSTAPAPICRGINGGDINLKATAIGVNFPDNGLGDTLVMGNGDGALSGGFTADLNTWIQPMIGQDADALKTLTGQSALLTDAPGLLTESFTGLQRATPLVAGVLIDVIPDATCTSPDDANKLINPIDGNCITKDVLGNPRWDGNNARDIGAIQVILAPHLTVSATGDTTVDLDWTRPQDPDPAKPVTGYKVFYRVSGSSVPFMETAVSGADTLSTTIGSLVNGTEYQFKMVSVNSDGDNPVESNLVTATPYGPIGTPVVSPTPGNGQVRLSWAEPETGEHPGPLFYTVVYRPVGDLAWVAGPSFLSSRTTVIPGLVNGTEYEFGVYATATDGVVGKLGTTKATPLAPGKILIAKSTAPGGGTGFSFTQDIDNSGDFTLDDLNSKVFESVEHGSYTLTEAEPQALGYELTNISCVDGDPNGVASTVDVGARTATINVDSGETVQCTFFNAEDETVVIEKRTLPPGGSGFTFSDDIGTPNSFSLNDAETRTFTHVPRGSYQVTEGAMAGYELTAIDCTVEGVNVPGDLASRTANISLTQPGGNAHCTFTNTKLGTLIMRKQTLPDGAPDVFGYTISGPNTNDSGSLTDGDMTQVDNAKSGAWELTESLPAADWHLGDISCTSALGTSTFVKDLPNGKATVQLAPGDTMDCTFTNVEDETITVEK